MSQTQQIETANSSAIEKKVTWVKKYRIKENASFRSEEKPYWRFTAIDNDLTICADELVFLVERDKGFDLHIGNKTIWFDWLCIRNKILIKEILKVSEEITY